MAKLKRFLKLSDLTEIRTGFTFREKIEEVESGNAHVLQIKDIRNIATDTCSYTLFADALPQIDWQGKDNAIVSPESVLLPCRGEYLKAHYFVGNQDQSKALPLIVSSQFLIIMPNQNVVPEYLCWYLNQPHVQYELRKESQGSKMPMLSVSTVNQFEVEIPSLDIQQRIIELNRIWEQEQILTQQLLKNREQMMMGMFKQLLQGNMGARGRSAAQHAGGHGSGGVFVHLYRLLHAVPVRHASLPRSGGAVPPLQRGTYF